MKAAIMLSVFAIALAFSSAQAMTQDDMLQAVMANQEAGFNAGVASVLETENKESRGAYALIKYIVVPSKARSFIEVIEEAKKDAEGFKGYKAYDLVKTLDDNLSYIGWAAWESAEDLIHYIKSDAARKVIKYTEEEDIVTLISAVRPLV